MHEASAASPVNGFFRRAADFLQMTGDDRFRFLSGQVTCDVAKLQPGDGVYGFFTTAKGRIESDVTVTADAERLRLHLPPGRGPVILERLRKYIIVDRVEVETAELVAFAYVGPDADVARSELPEGTVALERQDGGFDVWLSPDDVASTASAWRDAGLRELDAETWERHRIESGRPRWGVDFGLDNFPKETGLEDAVSYTKGCYLGQEVVARIHYRGGVQRRLRGLRLSAEPSAATGADVVFNGKVVGKLGSAVAGPSGALGLAILHDNAAPGSTVELVDGGPDAGRNVGQGTVVELPFERPV